MHGPDKSTGSEYADSVLQVLERAAEADAAKGQQIEARRPVLTSGPALAVLALTFAGVIFYNVQFFKAQPEAVTPEQAELTSGISVMIATQAIEAYREEHGRLPESLAAIGFPDGSLEYRVNGEDYHLAVAMEGGEPVEFSSEEGPLGILKEMGLDVGESGDLPVPPAPPVR